MILRALIQKEFIQIRRNSFVPRMILLYPIMIICIMPWVANMEIKNVEVVLVDNDRSPLSEQLCQRIEASSYFHFRGMAPSYEDALAEVERGLADVIAVIPPRYEQDVETGRPTSILVAANAVNGVKGNLGSSYLSSIVMQNLPTPSALQQTSGGVVTRPLYNLHQDYKVLMIPALMAMVMILLCGFLPALNIVGEKEKGTIEQINVTPVSKMDFILAKLIPYWLIGMVDLTICLLLSWAIYDFTPVGSIALIYLLSILLAIIFSSIGLIVSNYSDTMQQAMLVMWFILVCMMLLSGLFTPTRSMPYWAQYMVTVIPVHYYIDAMRAVFVQGTSLQGIATQLLALTAFALFTATWAVVSYKKNA